jgi:thiol-disulfide isomerase/thioredoxin
LAAVFATAGLAKLLDLKGSQKAITDFGLPQWLVKPLGFGLPGAEIIVACLLLPVRSAWIGAIGALILLLVFTAAIAINLALGRKPDCHCFGQVHSEPVGRATLARNGTLALLAAILVWQARMNPGLGIRQVVREMTAVQVLEGTFAVLTLIALGALSWLVLHLFRQNGRLLLRIEALEANRALAQQPIPARPTPQGLPIGAKAIAFDLPRISGGRASLESFLRQGKPVLLISTDPNCGPCNGLMPEIAAWQKNLTSELNIVLLSHGRYRDNRAKAVEHGVMDVLIEKNHKIAEQYQALGTPTGLLIRADGTIGSPAVGGADRIRQLVAHKAWTDPGYVAFMNALTQPQLPLPRPVLPVGSPAPAFALPDLNGSVTDSTHFNGNGTMLLFWNPACGFCQQMLPQIKEWEKVKAGSAPRLVLISSGSRDANRAMGLESAVLLDDKFGVGQLYGANGTPAGLLIDSDGKIASGLAVGASALMEILGGSRPIPDAGRVVVATES